MFKLPATAQELTTIIILWIVHIVVYLVSDSIAEVIRRNITFAGRLGWTELSWLRYLLRPPHLSPRTDAVYGMTIVPLVEEIVFFGLPALVMPILAVVVSPLLFALVHVLPQVDAAEKCGLPSRVKNRILAAELVAYYPPALVSGILWALGYGYISIIDHVIVNTQHELRILRSVREREKLVRELARKSRFNPFVESFVE